MYSQFYKNNMFNIILMIFKPIDASDESFWEQFWSENVNNVQDIFTLVPAPEIRALREEAPSNLATLCYKAVEKLVKAVDNSCRTQQEQQTVLNCVRLLTRLLPYIFEDSEWRGFFWSSLPSQSEDEDESLPLAQSLLNAVCVSAFCVFYFLVVIIAFFLLLLFYRTCCFVQTLR